MPLVADRERARAGAWYEMVPRSQGKVPGKHGTFDDCIARLPEIAALGFDVLYFTPIHPIGRTNRKGKNNSLKAGPDDPGSFYAIGNEQGGHDAVHPELGTLADFRRLVAACHKHDMEIALDFAVQCSPDHPWLKEHPEWFSTRPDGSISYAENPPKKYEDIVNPDFNCADRIALWEALRDVILFWVEQGVKIFRVDNPHTKPLPFWEWLIHEVQARHPDVLFLAEAFTRPKVMKALAKLGFSQSYTYFTWRTEKEEMQAYLSELTGYPRSAIITGPISSSPRRTSTRCNCRPARPGCSSRARRSPPRCRRITASTMASSSSSTSRSPAARNSSIRKNTRSRRATGTSPATSRTICAGST